MLQKSCNRKIITKSLEEKYKGVETGLTRNSKEVATKPCDVPFRTFSMWVKSKDKISAAFENGRKLPVLKLLPVDKAIYKWFINTREGNVPVSGTLLREKEVHFAKGSFKLKIIKF